MIKKLTEDCEITLFPFVSLDAHTELKSTGSDRRLAPTARLGSAGLIMATRPPSYRLRSHRRSILPSPSSNGRFTDLRTLRRSVIPTRKRQGELVADSQSLVQCWVGRLVWAFLHC